MKEKLYPNERVYTIPEKKKVHERTSPCRCTSTVSEALMYIRIYFTATDEIWPFPVQKTIGDHNGLRKEVVNKNTYWALSFMNNKFRNKEVLLVAPMHSHVLGYDTMYSKFTEYFKCTRKTKPQLIAFPGTVFLIQFSETENYEFYIPVLFLRHALCHILFLPCKTHADFAEGILFSKPSPSVEMYTFNSESVLCQWSLSKASTKAAAWNLLNFRWLEEEEKSEAFILPGKLVFPAPRDFGLLHVTQMNWKNCLFM